MTTYPPLDPKLADLKKQIQAAFAGEPPDKILSTFAAPTVASPGDTTVQDAAALASTMLSAYHVAATINPTKAFRPKAFKPIIRVSDPSELTSQKFWDGFWRVVEVVGPLVINAVSKDYDPRPSGSLADVIRALPSERRNDPAFVGYATNLLLTLSQGTVQAMSGQKDFTNPANQPPIPQPPANKDKDWFDDVVDFVVEAGKYVLPVAMMLV